MDEIFKVFDNAIATAGAVYTTKYAANAAQQPQLGQGGYYTEGQSGVQPAGTIGGIPTSALLIGGALLLAVVLVKG